MRNFALRSWAFAAAFAAALSPSVAAERRFDHIYVIVLENHDFDDAFDAQTPFLLDLSKTRALATNYHGVAHPSLPNYLAMIGGDTFGVTDDAASCFASDLAPLQSCNKIDGESLADQLEAASLDFAFYGETLPAPGALVQWHPGVFDKLYAQKHNPFAYFRTIATSPARLAKLKPFDAFGADLAGKMANVVFIVPNQCHDGHGAAGCNDEATLKRDYDAFAKNAIELIRKSPNWTAKSAIVVTFDEGEVKKDAPDENHIATVVATKCGKAMPNGARFDHYSLLATIEDGFGLPRLRKAASAPSMMEMFGRGCK